MLAAASHAADMAGAAAELHAAQQAARGAELLAQRLEAAAALSDAKLQDMCSELKSAEAELSRTKAELSRTKEQAEVSRSCSYAVVAAALNLLLHFVPSRRRLFKLNPHLPCTH